MLIGIISDTHIPNRTRNIPDKVFDTFKDVDLILHAGDIESLDVIKSLEKIAPVKAIQGNCDPDLGLNEYETMKIEDVKLGLTHGTVHPRGDTQQLYYIAKELDVDILVSGHTHQAMIKKIDDVLLLNPGSPTQPRLTDPTVMLLEINKSEVKPEIIKIGKPTCKALDFTRFKH